jgi:hypothetical protein
MPHNQAMGWDLKEWTQVGVRHWSGSGYKQNVPILQHNSMWHWSEQVGTNKMYLTFNPRCIRHWSGSGYRQNVPILQPQQYVTSEQWTGRYRQLYLSSNPPLHKTLEWIWVQAECTDPPTSPCRRHWSGSGYEQTVSILQSQLDETLEWIWVQVECTYPPVSGKKVISDFIFIRM